MLATGTSASKISRQVVIALNYAAAHRDEVDVRIRANQRALEDAERIAAERARLLA
jgi:hypothetical protein